ncbi:hypothetical protein P168DRAFT_321017 [Aspergillus campestris IBT 28561]|uniref:Uncharacterized protein n=1 Tax=Aspergillus campestris (strain IBT 28561) TaxID=1392248 RepID=A0A2I1CUY6_ASPC2|nr:uncharacterized protein P168DRAFT_321017 [Aspergillus campestris IBT 28561]PKY01427.1 hypothetical protein P168DRAFT_321017 [Aspergillus campestris IBT 28561]
MKPALPVLLLAAIATAAPIPENIPRAEGQNLLGLLASMGGVHSLLMDSVSFGGHSLKEMLAQDNAKGEGKGKGKEGAEEAPAAEAPPAAEGQKKSQEGQGAESGESQGKKADQA